MDFGPYADLVKTYVYKPYREIENKIYIDQFQGLWALHEKYDLLKNSEVSKLLQSMMRVINEKDPDVNNLLEQEKLESLDFIMNKTKYTNIILKNIKTQNFPSEFKGKKVFFLSDGKIHEF
jgi:hypothetical protein